MPESCTGSKKAQRITSSSQSYEYWYEDGFQHKESVLLPEFLLEFLSHPEDE